MSVAGQDSRFRKSTVLNGNTTSTLQETWNRPTDWLVLPAVSSTEQKFVGLFAVFDQPNNFLTVRCTGNYTVDWGDGTSPQNYTSNNQATYNYTYSSISSSTNCTRGYRQVIVTITPQSGQNITAINFVGYYSTSQLSNSLTTVPWLDMRMSLPNATTLQFYSNIFGKLYSLENIEILSSNTNMYQLFNECNTLFNIYFKSSASITDARSAFNNCYELRNITLDVSIALGSDGGGMFTNCRNLKRSPAMNFGTTGYFWNLATHFSTCYSLEEVFPYPTASTSAFNSMFLDCRSLKSAPWMVTTAATTMASMFQGCTQLKYVPKYDMNGVTSVANMFSSCTTLQTVPEFDFSTVTNMSGLFNGCTALKSTPTSLTTTGTLTNISNIFSGCLNLTSIPLLTTTSVTNFDSAFNVTGSLVIPAYDASAATSMLSPFGSSLTRIQVTNMSATVGIGNNQLQKTEVEEFFNNLKRVTASRTVQLNSNPGTATYLRSCTTTSGSNVMTTGNTGNVVNGMYAVGTNLASTKSVTFQDTGDTVTLTAHGLSDGKKVAFSVITTTTGILINTPYYVVNATTDTFQLSDTAGGSALPLTSDGSGTIMLMYMVTGTVTNTSITLDAPATTTGTQNITFYTPDISIPRFKGWTIG